MAISDEITRLQQAKADLKTAIENKGVTVPSSTKLDGYADLVDSIQVGGGSSDVYEFLYFNDSIGGISHSVPLMEKNLVIVQTNFMGRDGVTITYKNSSTGKKFTYTIPAGYRYYFLCKKNASIVPILTQKTTVSIT